MTTEKLSGNNTNKSTHKTMVTSLKTAASRKSIPWTDDETPIEMAVNIMGKRKFNPEELSQHTFIAGGTGSGKTTSAIKPMLDGFWNYKSKHGFNYAMLVVDPKVELAEYLLKKDEQAGTDRVVLLGHGEHFSRLDPFEGYRDLTSFVDKMEAAFLMVDGNQAFSGDNGVFRDSGLSLLRDFAALEEGVYLASGISIFSMLSNLFAPEKEDPNFFDGVDVLIRSAMASKHFSFRKIGFMEVGMDPRAFEGCITVFDGLSVLVTHYAPACLSLTEPFEVYAKEVLKSHGNKDSLRQFGYYTSYLKSLIGLFTHPRFKEMFDLNLTLSAEHESQIGQWLDAGKTLVLTPEMGLEVDEMIVKLIKRAAFNHMLTRENKVAPMAYVADEFQNFITSDEQTGEQNFLSMCRSFRVSCVLATQSIAALKDKVTRQSDRAGESALLSMLNNLNNRMIFSTKDTETVAMLKNWIEPPQNKSQSHVVDNFPPAALNVGQCYWLRGAEWSRDQIQLVQKVEPIEPRMTLSV